MSTPLQTPKEYSLSAGVVYIGKIVDRESFRKFDARVNKNECEGQMTCSIYSSEDNFIMIEMFDSVYSFSRHVEMLENGSKERKENYQNLMKGIGGKDDKPSFTVHCFGKLPNDLKKLVKEKYNWIVYDEGLEAMNFIGHLWSGKQSFNPW